MDTRIQGGINIAMKVPTHQYAATVAFYRETLGLELFTDKPGHVGFIHGPNRLWLDEAPGHGQAEIWLELVTPDFSAAAAHLAAAGVARNDGLEDLGAGFRGGWFVNPAGIVQLLHTPDALGQ